MHTSPAATFRPPRRWTPPAVRAFRLTICPLLLAFRSFSLAFPSLLLDFFRAALCFWGIAVCNGPNLQLTVSPQGQKLINDAARTAQAIAHQQPTLTAKTKRLIEGVMALVDGEPEPKAEAAWP